MDEKDSSSKEEIRTGSESPQGESPQDRRRGTGVFPVLRNAPFWLLLLLIPWTLSIWLRLLPASIPCARQWATDSVYDSHREKCARSLSGDPRMKDRKRVKTLIDREFELYKSRNRAMLDREIGEQEASMISGLSYQHGGRRFTYLGDYDPYLYLRYARNLLSHRLQGDLKKGNGQWDNHVLAPLGVPVTPILHPVIISGFYTVLSRWDPAYTIMAAAFYVPLVFSMLAALGVFLIARRFAGNMAGVTASTLFAVNPFLISRSLGSDTDIYNVTLPVFAALFLLEGLRSQKMTGKIIFLALSGVSLGLFCFAWMGWWFMLYFLFGSLILAIPALIFIEWLKGKPPGKTPEQKEGVKELLLCITVLMVSTFLSATLFSGDMAAFGKAWARPFEMAGMKDSLLSSLWPNIFLSVDELQPGNYHLFFKVLGGELFFFLSCAGCMIIAAHRQLKSLARLVFSILFIIWIGGTFYGSLKGVRFLLLLVPPFSITAGVSLAALFQWLSTALCNFKTWKVAGQALAILFITVLLSTQISAGYREAVSDIPVMNTAYEKAFTVIREQSSPDAIVTSYWDPGDFITFGADRAVTVDNHTLEKPPTYWVSRIFTSRDEKEALAILRMLNCGSNTAFEVLNGTMQNTERSISVLNKALTMKKDDAVPFIMGCAGEAGAKALTPLIFGEPREQYFVITGDLAKKAPYWGHYGFWDFRKAGIASSVEKAQPSSALRSIRENCSMTGNKAVELFFNLQALNGYDRETWISPRPSYISSAFCEEKGNTLVSSPVIDGRQYHVIIDRKTFNVLVQDSRGVFQPISFVYCTPEGEVTEKRYENPGFPYSIILAEGENSQVIVSSPEIANTVFTRLFFLKGKGLEHFTMIHHGKVYDGTEIDVWKVRFPLTP
ncbi:MAG: STT3 domain-containing protein [Candidatus Xenobiia bacterium LiM19]